MFEPTGLQRDAASTIFNLSDYRVISAFDMPGQGRRVEVESTSAPGCPTCGVVSVRVHLVDALSKQCKLQANDAAAAKEAWCNTHDLVFSTEVGTPLDPSNVRRAYNRIAKETGIVHLHPPAPNKAVFGLVHAHAG